MFKVIIIFAAPGFQVLEYQLVSLCMTETCNATKFTLYVLLEGDGLIFAKAYYVGR